MSERTVVMELSVLEAAHLTDLVEQFATLLDETDEPLGDPAVARLVPAAYSDDVAAADEFRRLTQADLLSRRAADAAAVLASLRRDGARLAPETLAEGEASASMTVRLDAERAGAWLRTLAALRLVLASRLGIEHDDDRVEDDPRFGVYDWLGYRLEGLVDALDR